MSRHDCGGWGGGGAWVGWEHRQIPFEVPLGLCVGGNAHLCRDRGGQKALGWLVGWQEGTAVCVWSGADWCMYGRVFVPPPTTELYRGALSDREMGSL